jgi:hypothetical protein
MEQIKQAFIESLTRDIKDDRDNNESLNRRFERDREMDEEFDSDEEDDLESDFNKQVTKSVSSLISKSVIINNYEAFLKSYYYTQINSLKLKYLFKKRIKFELEDGRLLIDIPELAGCLIGDFELEMEVPDGVRFYLEFVNMKNYSISYSSNTVHLMIKDNRAKSSSRMLDDTKTRYLNKTVKAFEAIRDMVVYVIQDLNKVDLPEKKEVKDIFEEMTECLRERSKSNRTRLEIRILDIDMIPLNHTLHANFKCRYKDFSEIEIQTLRKLRRRDRSPKINAEIVKKVESLY